jgi:hypothetical protein
VNVWRAVKVPFSSELNEDSRLVGRSGLAHEQPFFCFYARWNENRFVALRTFKFFLLFRRASPREPAAGNGKVNS